MLTCCVLLLLYLYNSNVNMGKEQFLILTLVSVLLFSCTELEKGVNTEKVFRYNESKGITTLDPAFARSLPLIWPAHQLFNGLVQLSDSLTVDPCIAHSWTKSENGLVYTFNLRKDVYFHNSLVFPNEQGRRVVADDFVYSFNRIIDPKTASPGVWIFSVLNSKIPNNGCVAVNDTTLELNLEKPFPPFLGLLSMPYAYVVPQEAVEYFGIDFRTNPVGTGPFFLKYWREGEGLIMRRNPNYFEFDQNGVRLPYLEAISISFIVDKQSEFLAFLLGNIDFISGVHSSSKDELLTRSGTLNPKYRKSIKMITGPYLNTEYLGFMVDTSLQHVNKSPIGNPNVRKAIAYGFDRDRMMLYLRSNLGYPAHSGLIPKGMPGFTDSLKGYRYNPDLAKRLLAQAGYPNGKGLDPISLSTTEDYVDICEFLQHQLSEIGIPISIEVIPGAAYREMMASSKLLFFRGSWVADYADAENYLSLLYSGNFSPSGPNYTHFSNDKFDGLYHESLSQNDDTLRHIYYLKMDSLALSYAPIIPMYYDKVVRFVGSDVAGMTPNPMNLLTLKRVKKIKNDTYSR